MTYAAYKCDLRRMQASFRLRNGLDLYFHVGSSSPEQNQPCLHRHAPVDDVSQLPLVASCFLCSVTEQRTPNVSVGAQDLHQLLAVDLVWADFYNPQLLTFKSPAMDIIKDGWFTETCTLWPGQAMSLQVEEVLYHKKSKFQDVMVFKRWVVVQSGLN